MRDGNVDDQPTGRLAGLWRRLVQHPLEKLGPGLITGVADDDPSGIATYSQAGAQFGLDMLWTLPLTYPLMAAVQSMCARLGRVTGKGLAANIKAHFPPWVLWSVVVLLVIADTLNIGADVAAMGESAQLVLGLDSRILTVAFALLTLSLQLLVPYHRYVVFLKWLTLALLAYGVVLFTVRVPWGAVVAHTLYPRFKPTATAATTVIAVFGTTISPYLFFWQASEEVEDMEEAESPAGRQPLVEAPARARPELRRIRWDTWSGMLYSNVAAYCIVLATAVTLHSAGITDIETAAQAASALRPLAGGFASVVFTLGILGVGLIGVPVLAGASGYAIAEAMGWPWGLERKATDARGFYAVIAAGVLAGLVLEFTPISPMKALFWSAVINGVVATPLVVVIVLLCRRSDVMGGFTVGRVIRTLGWITAAVMGAASLGMFVLS
ncbi:NRAMP family divalent metal transporter [Phenylobacterium montanum]|uniref:Divalent metal cation transporter n=1 Tax=Phenylobacterium montanum TaxID=2823693 RepID=A0A975FYH8_9CAUL|nr:divalent metal cation transporter [Caulobacter sp. S6]QUD87529.1 divalent metal cation transporter [Caulobacter sp. S6]